MRSQTVRSQIEKLFGIHVHAQSLYKRNLAERGIKEIKTKMKLLLDLKGTNFF